MKIPSYVSRFLTTGFLLCLPGCLTDAPCPTMGIPAAPAIVVTVWDATTGAPIIDGVTGVAAVDGEPIEFQWMDGNRLWAYGPVGTYDLFLAKDGYRAWFRGSVTVTGTRCRLKPTSLRADMVPVEHGLSNGPLQPPPAPGE